MMKGLNSPENGPSDTARSMWVSVFRIHSVSPTVQVWDEGKFELFWLADEGLVKVEVR